MTSITDGEDVNDFLLRIRELGEKRDKEDEERTKKLEEDILQSRKERQARRAGKEDEKAPRISSLFCDPELPPFTLVLLSLEIVSFIVVASLLCLIPLPQLIHGLPCLPLYPAAFDYSQGPSNCTLLISDDR